MIIASEVVKVEAVTDYFFLGLKITLDSDSNHEIKRCLLLGRKAMTNVDSVLKAETSFFDTFVSKLHSQIDII